MTTIAQERAALKTVGRPLRTREQAGFRFDYTTPRPVTEPASLVFVHITITNPENYASDDAHARAVEAIGISRFPNTGVSYNRLLFQSGRAQEAQPVGRRGAHTVNDKNITRCVTTGCPGKGGSIPSAATNLNTVVRAYAICQNVDDAVTDAELDSLARTIAADMLAGFVRRDAAIHGHRCVANKDCPAAKMWARMAELRNLVNHYVSTGFKPPTTEDDMPYTPEQLRAMMQAENEEYGARLWGAPTGTGTALIATVDGIAKAVLVITNQLSDLKAQITQEDVADDAALQAATDQINKGLSDLQTSVDQMKAGLPKA